MENTINNKKIALGDEFNLIRFPAMAAEMMLEFFEMFPDLFTQSEVLEFMQHKLRNKSLNCFSKFSILKRKFKAQQSLQNINSSISLKRFKLHMFKQ